MYLLVAELVSTLLAFIIVVLHTYEKNLAWPLNLLKKLLSMIVFYSKGLYIKCLVDSVLMLNSYYGWNKWRSKGSITKGSIQRLELYHFVRVVVSCVITGVTVGYLYKTYTHCSLPYWDALHAVFVVATYILLAQKKPEAWIFWIFANMIYLPVCWHKGTYLFFIKYILYTSMACYAYYKWSRQAEKNTHSEFHYIW